MTTALEQMGADDDEKDESSGDMVFVRGENGSKQVKEGTLEKLCERLTKPGVIGRQWR